MVNINVGGVSNSGNSQSKSHVENDDGQYMTFNDIDVNHDGKITTKECDMAKISNERMSEIDINNDGKITKNEWTKDQAKWNSFTDAIQGKMGDLTKDEWKQFLQAQINSGKMSNVTIKEWKQFMHAVHDAGMSQEAPVLSWFYMLKASIDSGKFNGVSIKDSTKLLQDLNTAIGLADKNMGVMWSDSRTALMGCAALMQEAVDSGNTDGTTFQDCNKLVQNIVTMVEKVKTDKNTALNQWGNLAQNITSTEWDEMHGLFPTPQLKGYINFQQWDQTLQTLTKSGGNTDTYLSLQKELLKQIGISS